MSNAKTKTMLLGMMFAAMFFVLENQAEAKTPPIKVDLQPKVSLSTVQLDAVINFHFKLGNKVIQKEVRISAIKIKRKGGVITVKRKAGPIKLTFRVGMDGKYVVGYVQAKAGFIKLPKIDIRKKVIN